MRRVKVLEGLFGIAVGWGPARVPATVGTSGNAAACAGVRRAGRCVRGRQVVGGSGGES